MKKVKNPKDAIYFEQIPNIGKAMTKDFKVLGLRSPKDLANQDPYQLYQKLCKKTQAIHDPCVLDTFMAAVHFMQGKGARSWWSFTAARKRMMKTKTGK